MIDRTGGRLLLLMLSLPTAGFAAERVYFNDFSAPAGTLVDQWRSPKLSWVMLEPPGTYGTLPPPPVAIAVSPSGRHFLGEFGGPVLGHPGDKAWGKYQENQVVVLTLDHLPIHRHATISFDLLVLKDWEGAGLKRGPDYLGLSVRDGPELFSSSFSNRPLPGDPQNLRGYSMRSNAKTTYAVAANSLGYLPGGDSTFHLTYTFKHAGDRLELMFVSSLSHAKGLEQQSWGVADVEVTVSPD